MSTCTFPLREMPSEEGDISGEITNQATLDPTWSDYKMYSKLDRLIFAFLDWSFYHDDTRFGSSV